MDPVPQKAGAADFLGRFREIVSDPLNVLIRRHPLAGVVDQGWVRLHNGLEVPASGPHAYYGEFSNILVINRGVHEPLEEYLFQQLLARLPQAPAMLELGAYWGHYSMWLKSARPRARVDLVEPEALNLEAGRRNFERNGFDGTFLHAFVGRGMFMVDEHLAGRGDGRLDILHADIQGYELEMLEGCRASLDARRIDHVFVSTHSQELHQGACGALAAHGYRVEVSSDFDQGTTSYDGLVYASNPDLPSSFAGFAPIARARIPGLAPAEVGDFLIAVRTVTRSAPEVGR